MTASRTPSRGTVALAATAVAAVSVGPSFIASPQVTVQPLQHRAAAPQARTSLPAGALAAAALGVAFVGNKTAQRAKHSAVACRAESIAATAINNGNFTVLVKALQTAGLVDAVSGTTPLTVFAPTDAAFTALLAELGVTAEQLLANPDLKDILLYHVVSGTAMSSNLKDGMMVQTLQGASVEVKIAGGNVSVGRAKVTAADIACTNGVIHVLDKVILPPKKVKFDPAKEVGAGVPFGFFDPAGFCKQGAGGPGGDEAGFRNLRASEIKHGRVAMMASIGAVAQHYIRFPGFEQVPAGIEAIYFNPAETAFIGLFALSGVMELFVWTENARKEPGNFGDPLGLKMYDAEMRTREINNGRMAMFATMGIFVAEVVTGKDGVQQLGL